MKQKIYILLLFLFPLFIFSQNDTEINDKIISENFIPKGFHDIEIFYTKKNGCIDSQVGKIYIKASNDKFFFSHLSSNKNDSLKSFWGNNYDIINYVHKFEKQSYINNERCGGIISGTGVDIKMKIDNLKTHFGYCENKYDGINTLITDLAKHKKN